MSPTTIKIYIDTFIPGSDGHGKVWSYIRKIWWIQLRAMEISFSILCWRGRGLWGHIDASKNKPEGTDVIQIAEDWWCKNHIVNLGSVDTDVGISMRGFKTAARMWSYLERVYQQSNLAENFNLNKIYWSVVKIQEYYDGFIALWDEYELVDLGSTKIWMLYVKNKLQDERRVVQFLMKLR